MLPRSRRQAQQQLQGQHAPATIGSLSDDLLAKCFALIGQKDL